MKIFISGMICVVRGLMSSELAGSALYIHVKQKIKMATVTGDDAPELDRE